MRIKMRLIPLIVSVWVVSFQSGATDTSINNDDYLYGYTKKEIHSIPRISVRGFDDPELIKEHAAWAFYFRHIIGIYEDDRDDALFVLRKLIPTLTTAQLNSIIQVAQEALFQASYITNEIEDFEFSLCQRIIAAAKNGAKLSNKQIKTLLHQRDQKLPRYYEKVKATLKAELSAQMLSKLEQYVKNKVRQGMSYSELNVEGLANLRAHQHAYSDLYQAVLCSHKIK